MRSWAEAVDSRLREGGRDALSTLSIDENQGAVWPDRARLLSFPLR